MIEQGIIDLLNTDQTVSSLVRGSIYRVMIPQTATYPALLLHLIGASSDHSFEGNDFAQKTLQIEGWAENDYDAQAVRKAVNNVLSCYSGLLSNGVYIKGAFGGTEIDFFEGDSYKFRAIVEYTLFYTEP